MFAMSHSAILGYVVKRLTDDVLHIDLVTGH